ncbi:hypothetical protein Btru_036006 [Bulinus truncatus]|nr:hypothetical protein Btru_036006 [Bulinus truncatus]
MSDAGTTDQLVTPDRFQMIFDCLEDFVFLLDALFGQPGGSECVAGLLAGLAHFVRRCSCWCLGVELKFAEEDFLKLWELFEGGVADGAVALWSSLPPEPSEDDEDDDEVEDDDDGSAVTRLMGGSAMCHGPDSGQEKEAASRIDSVQA